MVIIIIKSPKFPSSSFFFPSPPHFISSNLLLLLLDLSGNRQPSIPPPLSRSSTSIGFRWRRRPPRTRMDVASWHLDGNADAVEFCPHQSFHHILAAATYTLEDDIRSNCSGSISLFCADGDMGLELVHRIQTVGVFDVKWSPPGSTIHRLLAQADADGCLTLYSSHLSD